MMRREHRLRAWQAMIIPLMFACMQLPGNGCATAAVEVRQRDPAPRWDVVMRAGNAAAMKGDIETALRYWSQLHRYTSDHCLLVFAHANVQAAKDTLRDIRRFRLDRRLRYARLSSYQDKYWQGNPCNR